MIRYCTEHGCLADLYVFGGELGLSGAYRRYLTLLYLYIHMSLRGNLQHRSYRSFVPQLRNLPSLGFVYRMAMSAELLWLVTAARRDAQSEDHAFSFSSVRLDRPLITTTYYMNATVSVGLCLGLWTAPN